MPTLYEKNLQYLHNHDENLAQRLSHINPSTEDHTDSLQEAQKYFNSLKLHNKHVLYLFGVGKGYFYLAAKKWLQQHYNHILVLIEDDDSVWRALLNEKHAADLLQDKQVVIAPFCMKDFDSWVSDLTITFVGLEPYITAHTRYKVHRSALVAKLQQSLIIQSLKAKSFYDEAIRYGGSAFYHNFYENLFKINTAKNVNEMKGILKDIPFIISGAGPSLDKNIEALKEAYDNAIIFAAGSSLKVMAHYECYPHLAGGVDPNVSEIDRIKNHHLYEVPTLNTTRLNWQANRFIHAPSLFVYDAAAGYSIQRWLLEYKGITDLLDFDGCSIVCSAAEFATFLGCNPIIFVGTDLAFTAQSLYAKGVSNPSMPSEDKMEVSDIYGNKIETQWSWLIESDYLSTYAQKHPGTTFINATEGGIGFQGVKNMSLNEALKMYCYKKRDVSSIVHLAIQNTPNIQIHETELKNKLKCLKESVQSCLKLFNRMIDYNLCSLFSTISQEFIARFNSEHEALTVSIKSSKEGTEVHQQYLHAFVDLQDAMVLANETCSKILETVTQNDRSEDETTTSDQLRHDLEEQEAYQYLFKDIETILLLDEYRFLNAQNQSSLSLPLFLEGIVAHSDLKIDKIKSLITFANFQIQTIQETLDRHSTWKGG